jgi:hypothetical protein
VRSQESTGVASVHEGGARRCGDRPEVVAAVALL